MSRFRLGVLKLRLETARYVWPKVPPEQRLCLLCNNGEVEDESHFLLACNRYDQARQILFEHIPDFDSFNILNNNEKLDFLVNNPMIVKQTSKFLTNAFDYRSTII